MSTKISFLRGLHSALPTTAVDGVFYLTTDTHRLYVGQGTELVDLNKYIKTVANQAALPKTGAQKGDFYYIEDQNLLTVYNGTDYVLINKNTDTYITKSEFATSAANKTATVTQTLTLNDNTTKTAFFKVTGGAGIKSVTAAGNAVTIDGNVYTLRIRDNVSDESDETSADYFWIELLKDGNLVDGSACKIVAGSNIKIDKNTEGSYTISAPDQVNQKVKGVALALGTDGKITTTVTNYDDTTVAGTLDKAITYSVGGTNYVPGQPLPVYTKTEIDNKMKGLNAMTYKGTLGATNGTIKALPTSKVSIGDTYLVVDNIVYETGKTAKNGDLLIAVGTEGADGYVTSATLAWTYVPSGNEKDTTYKFVVDTATHKVSLADNANVTTGSHTLAAGASGKITLTSSGSGANMTTTVEHAAVTVTPTTETAESHAKSVTALTGITVDSTGHVTGYKTKVHTLLSYSLGNVVTTSNNKATITHALKDSKNNNHGEAAFSIGSTSLEVTSDANKAVSIELTWGSF